MAGLIVVGAAFRILGRGWSNRKVTSPASPVFVAASSIVDLPSSKQLLLPAPGHPQSTNSFPTAVVESPDGRYAAILNNGYGTEESGYRQSIAIIDLNADKLSDFPDARLGKDAHQTYFLGLAFSANGKKLYASVASITDPTGARSGNTGNGIAVYGFQAGHIVPQGFIKIPLAPLAHSKHATQLSKSVPRGMAIPFPAGLARISGNNSEKLLVAENLADDAILIDAASGQVLRRFNLSSAADVPAVYPYGVVATRDGKTGFCSLWNASQVAQLDLESGRVAKIVPLLAPASKTSAGSHPTAMLLSPDDRYLYVALANRDRVAVIDTAAGTLVELLSTELPGQGYSGFFPNALAQTADGKRLFAADASGNAVVVFDVANLWSNRPSASEGAVQSALGFIPTEWYPTALAVRGDELIIVTGKGEGTGPNSQPAPPGSTRKHPYIATLIHGSVARMSLEEVDARLAKMTAEVRHSNRIDSGPGQIRFPQGGHPIRHVIYIIKENRTYDQILGDLKPGNGEPALVLYGQDVTPNLHNLARQFGILDDFYDSGEVSGDGHAWSMAAITSDYNEKTWPIGYRSKERNYDYEGVVSRAVPFVQGIPDIDEPGTGYIWANVARHGLTHRNYGEFVSTHWCDGKQDVEESPTEGTPQPLNEPCPQAFVRHGHSLPPNVGQPHGSKSPWPWPVPMIARNEATKPELQGNFDPQFADFRLDYPDQLRVDEFLNEFEGFVRARKESKGAELPQFVILRLPNDHTAGTKPGMPRPVASVADNDLAVGRVVEAISHSPYWDDTAIFILEDDAQDGADHVDAHRSIAFVISKYAPGSAARPFVDAHFYITVSMLRTIEVLLGLPPMNHNDAHAPVMAPMFSGEGNQPPFTPDYRNRDNGLIYQQNPPRGPGAQKSAQLDFSHADGADAATLNAILWHDRKGKLPLPRPRHVFRDP